MPLTAGARLGSYEIERLLGAGGMGEVYLAEDQRLHRQVALKILPADLADTRSGSKAVLLWQTCFRSSRPGPAGR